MPSPCPYVYNYATPGATIEDDLPFELSRFFSVFPQKVTPRSEPALNSTDTLYGARCRWPPWSSWLIQAICGDFQFFGWVLMTVGESIVGLIWRTCT